MFLSNVSKLLDKGYDSEDINGIFNELDGDDILFLIDNDYFKDIIKLLSVEYFRNDYFNRIFISKNCFYTLLGIKIVKFIYYTNIFNIV